MPRYLFALFCVGLAASNASAQTIGFALNRLDPTPSGEPTFFADHPWFSRTRWFAGGFTLNYAHNPLVLGNGSGGSFTKSTEVVRHQLIGHFDLAASVANRLMFTFMFPATFYESGTPVAGVAPISGAAAGDPRFGLTVRAFGEPYRDPFSLSFNATLFIPIGAEREHQGDTNVRGALRILVGGMAHKHVRWTFNAGFALRAAARLTPADTKNHVGHELQFSGALAYVGLADRLSVGAEAVMGTFIIQGRAFDRDTTSLEFFLASIHYLIKDVVQIGVGAGVGVLREVGNSDARFLFRLAYAPLRKAKKPAPTPPPPEPPPPPKPPTDIDNDGIIDIQDKCPTLAQGDHPDPRADHRGCPAADADGDGKFDHEDECPNDPSGAHPDSARPGCPLGDLDGDGILDDVDSCPDQKGIPSPDPQKHGCPAVTLAISRGKIELSEAVQFDTGTDHLKPESDAVLQAVANTLLANPQIKKVAIEGHTDNHGKPAFNLGLSKRRAAAVVGWLVAHGIATERLSSAGYGQTRPIATNSTDKGRAVNRRVDIRILEKSE